MDPIVLKYHRSITHFELIGSWYMAQLLRAELERYLQIVPLQLGAP